MAVLIGSARIDENGRAHGGKAGDQTGKEVSTQSWYKHSKGWVVLRAKDPIKAAKIAQAMRAACVNDNIGYDQYQNQTLWNAVKNKGYDPAKATVKCETDCARLVRVCCAYAGIMAKDFYTATEVAYLMDTGEFVKFTSSKYTSQDDYLGAGDILVTKTKGHTAVVLTNGDRYDGAVEEPSVPLGARILRNGSEGKDVEDLQRRLKAVGYNPGEIDGEYGPNTASAVKALRRTRIFWWMVNLGRTATRRCWRWKWRKTCPRRRTSLRPAMYSSPAATPGCAPGRARPTTRRAWRRAEISSPTPTKITGCPCSSVGACSGCPGSMRRWWHSTWSRQRSRATSSSCASLRRARASRSTRFSTAWTSKTRSSNLCGS